MQGIIIIDDTNCIPLLDNLLKLLTDIVMYDLSIANNPSQKQLFLQKINDMPLRKKITIKANDNIYLVDGMEITRVGAQKEKSILHLINYKPLETIESIEIWQAKLEDLGFLRVHEKHLVNIHVIVKLQLGDLPFLELNNGEIIPVDMNIQHKVAEKIERLLK
jgi:two-component system, LytTR family, response regulator